MPGTLIGDDLAEFITAARACGYSERTSSAMASQVLARLLFATGKRLHALTDEDFDALSAAGVARQQATGRTWRHYRGCASATRTVLFHHRSFPRYRPPPRHPGPTNAAWPPSRTR